MSEKNKAKKITFTDYLSVLLKWKKFLIITLFIITAITTIISFLIPEKFKATSTVMIQSPDNGGIFGNLTDLSGVLNKAFGSGGAGTPEEKLFGFLASNQLAEKIIDKFNLVDYYEVDEYKRDKTLKKFRDDFTFDLDDNGLIEVSMIHKNPETSAEIVNYAIEELEKMNLKYAIAYAKKYREFVEKRYFKNLDDLKKAETDLEEFQRKYKIYAIPEQLQASFAAYAELEKNLAVKQLERDLLKATQGTTNKNYQLLNEQVKLIKTKIENLKNGKNTSDESLIFVNIKNLPEIEKKYFSIKRELEVQAKLLEFTLPMYEQALMEEQKTIPTITVIDKAVPPELKYSPKKAVIILAVFFISLFLLLPFSFRGHRVLTNEPHNDYEIKEKAFYGKLAKWFGLPY